MAAKAKNQKRRKYSGEVISMEDHARQLTIRNNEIDRLKARCTALEAISGLSDYKLLEDLAHAIATGKEASEAAARIAPTDGEGGRGGKPGSRAPGGGNYQASRSLRRLEVTVERAVSAFWTSHDNDWKRPVLGMEDIEASEPFRPGNINPTEQSLAESVSHPSDRLGSDG